MKTCLRLVGLIKPLMMYMIFAITLGVLGFICANFLTVLATIGILEIYHGNSFSNILILLVIVFDFLQ